MYANELQLSTYYKANVLLHQSILDMSLDPFSTITKTNETNSDVPRFGTVVVISIGCKFPNLVTFNFCTQIMPRRFLVDTMYVHMNVLCKPAGNRS